MIAAEKITPLEPAVPVSTPLDGRLIVIKKTRTKKKGVCSLPADLGQGALLKHYTTVVVVLQYYSRRHLLLEAVRMLSLFFRTFLPGTRYFSSKYFFIKVLSCFFVTPESLDAYAAHDIPELDGAVPSTADDEVAVRVSNSVQNACFMSGKHLHPLVPCTCMFFRPNGVHGHGGNENQHRLFLEQSKTPPQSWPRTLRRKTTRPNPWSLPSRRLARSWL